MIEVPEEYMQRLDNAKKRAELYQLVNEIPVSQLDTAIAQIKIAVAFLPQDKR